MANHQDAIKRNKQNARRRAQNRHYRTMLRNHVKQLRALVTSGDVEAAQTQLRATVGIIQRVAGKGIIHRNTAARKIQRLNAAVKALVA